MCGGIPLKPESNSGKKRDGRVNFKSLQEHYIVKDNKAVRIKDAEVMMNTINHKNYRDMSFEKFLTNMKSIFTGFEYNGELFTEAHNIQLLSQKV